MILGICGVIGFPLGLYLMWYWNDNNEKLFAFAALLTLASAIMMSQKCGYF